MLLSVEKREFLLDLIDIINALGVAMPDTSILGNSGDGLVYDDELVNMTSIKNHKYLIVTRKSTDSPIIILENDVAICFHGEFVYLLEHINSLMKLLKEESNETTK